MTADLKDELEAAFREVLTRLHGQFTTHEAVAVLKDSYSDLWLRAGDVLATDYLLTMASRILRRPDSVTSNPDQMLLPGFEHLPRLIRVKGQYIAIEDANLGQLRSFKAWYDSRLAILLKRTEKFKQTAKELVRLIRLVERFDESRPGITVKTVLVLRAEKQAARSKVSPEDRREIAESGSRAKWRRDSEA